MAQEMVEIQDHMQTRALNWLNLLFRSVVSLIFVLLTQFVLSLVPLFFYSSSILLQLSFSALVLLGVTGFGGWGRRLLGVNALAPAFVFFSILFVWGVYVAFVRPAMSHLMDILFDGEVALLIVGLYCMVSSDPGFMAHESSGFDKLPKSSLLEVDDKVVKGAAFYRIRYCKICKVYVRGFDHHCPAFGNCVGDNNHLLFMILLIGFISTEATYLVCLSQLPAKYEILDTTIFETHLHRNVVTGTFLFSILQLLWQAVFLTWHIYCICFNIRTDEWINWSKYPEFQVFVQSQMGQGSIELRFRNPYDKGVIQNVKEFLSLKR